MSSTSQSSLRMPDFHAISESHGTLKTEFDLCQNLLVVNSSAVLDAITTLSSTLITSMAQLEQTFSTRIGQLEGRIDQLEGRIGQLEGRIGQLEGRIDQLEGNLTSQIAASYNSLIRQVNGKTNQSDAPIMALHHYKTNAIIPNFPATVEEIQNLHGPNIREFLRAVGAVDQGTVRECKNRFLLHIGMIGVMSTELRRPSII